MKKLFQKNNPPVMLKKSVCKTEPTDLGTQAEWIIFDALFNWSAFLTDAPIEVRENSIKTEIAVELDRNVKD